jgi:parallel beta-helix repeat protein
MKNPIKVKIARRTIAVAVMAMLVSTLFLVSTVTSEMAMQTVFINSDGSVDPASVPIQRSGNTYFFTGDVYACLIVGKSNVVIDGAGYTLRGALNGTPADVWIGQGPSQEAPNGTGGLPTMGIDAADKSITGLTIKNLNIIDFSIGMYVKTTNNTVTGNAVVNNIVGVLLSGSDNDIVGNYIADNEMGLFFGTTEPGNVPLNLTVSHNSFSNNTYHLSGCVCKEYNMSEAVHTWDNGEEGNYWSDYNGADADGDGIGDTPYVIDVLNQDRYPLMQSYVAPPTVAAKVPVETVVVAAVLSAIVIVSVFAVRKRRKKA